MHSTTNIWMYELSHVKGEYERLAVWGINQRDRVGIVIANIINEWFLDFDNQLVTYPEHMINLQFKLSFWWNYLTMKSLICVNYYLTVWSHYLVFLEAWKSKYTNFTKIYSLHIKKLMEFFLKFTIKRCCNSNALYDWNDTRDCRFDL